MVAYPILKEPKIRIPGIILLSFFIFTVGILILGRVYYRSQLTRIKKEAEESLTAISLLKVRQITQWHSERLGNAEQIGNNNPLVKSIKGCIGFKSQQENEADVKQWMNSMASNYDYNSVSIYDTLQMTRLVLTQSDSILPEITKIAFGEALKDMKARMTDLYMNRSSGKPTIDLIVPLGLKNKNQLSPIGVIVLGIDPEKILFPLIQSWPTPSKSAETLLIRKEGDSVLYLNDLRHIKNTSLNLMLPISDVNLPAAKAVYGYVGVVEGVDYRKIPVVAYLSAIPGLNWFMVSKIDKEEIQTPLKKFLVISVVVIILLILIVLSVLLFWIRTQKLKEIKNLYQSELDRKQLDETLIISEARYRRLFEAARDGILILEAETGLIVDVNPFLIEMLGVTREQFLKKSIWEIGFFKDITANKEKFLELQQKEYVRYEDLPLETSDGRKFHVDFVSNVYQVSGYKVIQCNIRDITKRKEMEDALAEFNNQFRKLSSNAPGMIFQFTRRLNGTYCVPIASEGIKNIYGLSPGDVIDDFSPIAEVILPEDLERVVRDIEYSAEHLTLFNCDFRAQIPGEPVKWLNTKSTPEKLNDGIITWYGYISDITDRKEAEELLQKSEEKFRTLFESIGDAVMISELLENGEIGKFIQVNDAACKRMGYSREEMLRKTPLELNSEKSRESVNPKIKNIIIEKHAIVEAEHVTKDGRIIPVEISTTVTQLNNKTIFLSIARDISERKLAEEKLRETNEYLSNLFNYANAPIIVWDTSLSITKFNPAFENLSGYIEEEVLGNKIDILFPEDKAVSSLEMISRTISGERWETVEIEIKRKDGDRRIVIWNSANILDKDGETVVETIAQGQDITKRKRAEEELKESENRFRQTFVLSPVGIVMVGLDKRFQRCNNSFSQSLGYKPEELIGKAIADVTFHEDIEIGIDEMMSILNEEIESTQIQKRYLRKDGNIVWGEVLISIVRDHKNQPQYFLAIIQDITERKLAVEYLIESERKLREAQKMAHLGFWSWEVKTGKVEWSDEVFKIFNLDPIKFTPQIDSIMSLSPWDGENQRDKELINRAMENHTPGEYEQKFLRPDMTIGYYYSTFQGKYKENGDLLTIVGTILDITERKKAEATLRESEDKFKYVFDHSVIGKSITLPSGEITVNRAFCEMTGYSEEELKSMNWREISHPDDIDMTEKELQSLISGKNSSVRFTKRYIHKNGSVVWADVGTALRRDIDGKPLYYMTAVGEITSLKNAEENILRLNQELEEKVILRTEQLSIANKELEAFSYSVSHDLRSPLRAVHSFTNILLEDYEKVLDDEGKRICRIITSSTVQMGGLIDDLLNFSRIGRSEVKLGMLDMKSLASSVIDELCGGKSKNRVNLKLGKLSNAYGDLNLIRIVWTNLISNAIKYSSTKPDSKIVISSTHEDHTITYSVKDNGVGFDMNYINKLFGVFQRLHSEKDFEGNGVGLAIVQRIINKHGGKVWAVGEVGKGATFSFSLPAEGSRQLANQKPDA